MPRGCSMPGVFEDPTNNHHIVRDLNIIRQVNEDRTRLSELATVLSYAPATPCRAHVVIRLLGKISVAFTGIAFFFAFTYIQAYVGNIGSTCGTPVAKAWELNCLAAIVACILSGAAFFFSLDTKYDYLRARTYLICLLANLFCAFTPALLQFRADVWPH